MKAVGASDTPNNTYLDAPVEGQSNSSFILFVEVFFGEKHGRKKENSILTFFNSLVALSCFNTSRELPFVISFNSTKWK